jgi:hypothetical protein
MLGILDDHVVHWTLLMNHKPKTIHRLGAEKLLLVAGDGPG